MKHLAPRIVLACILILMPTVIAFGQQIAKDLKSEGNVQTAITYLDRGLARLDFWVLGRAKFRQMRGSLRTV
jgi:hypothetical protein